MKIDWSRKRGQFQAYLAGIVDGEGSFGIYNLKGCWQGRLTIVMNDPQIALLFKHYYPGGSISKRRDGGVCVTYTHRHCYDITRELLPFLLCKWQQAKLLLSFIVHRRRTPFRSHGFGCPRCQTLAARIKALKAPSTKGMNSVEALLLHGMRQYRAKRADVEADVTAMKILLEGVETRDKRSTAVEPMSLPEQDIVRAA